GLFPSPQQPPLADVQPPAKPAAHARPPELPGVLPGEQAALGRALATVPQARFPSCRDLMTALIRANGLKVVWTDEGNWRILPDEDATHDGPADKPGRTRTFRR